LGNGAIGDYKPCTSWPLARLASRGPSLGKHLPVWLADPSNTRAKKAGARPIDLIRKIRANPHAVVLAVRLYMRRLGRLGETPVVLGKQVKVIRVGGTVYAMNRLVLEGLPTLLTGIVTCFANWRGKPDRRARRAHLHTDYLPVRSVDGVHGERFRLYPPFVW